MMGMLLFMRYAQPKAGIDQIADKRTRIMQYVQSEMVLPDHHCARRHTERLAHTGKTNHGRTPEFSI